jgi:hypothetical protein
MTGKYNADEAKLEPVSNTNREWNTGTANIETTFLNAQ